MTEPPLNLDVWQLPLRGSRLLEASAGTGKTWTLSALVVRLVLGDGGEADFVRPLLPAEILVMTFTRAATRELNDRIRQRLAQAALVLRDQPGADALCAQDTFLARLAQRLAADPEARERAAWRLSLAADAMDEAAVFTLDAWCQRVLREHAFDSGQLFNETLVPDERSLHRQAVQDHWRRAVYPLSPGQLQRLQDECPAFRSVETLLSDVQALLKAPADLPVASDAPATGADLATRLQAVWQQRQTEVMALKRACQVPFQRLADWLAEQTGPAKAQWNGHRLKAAYTSGWARQLLEWAQSIDDAVMEAPPLTESAWSRLSWPGLMDARKPNAPPLDCPPAVGQAIDLLQQVPLRLQALPSASAVARAHALAGVRERIAWLKAQRGQFGFADLPRRLAAALDHPGRGERLRQHIRQRYPVALIDEFQDTSPLQYRLLDRIYQVEANDPETALLLVGDPKQSIYGFRGADIRSYLQARQATQGRHHVLGVNHRSSVALVAAVNHLFAWREADAEGSGAFRMGAATGSAVPFWPVGARGRSASWRVAGQAAPALTLAHEMQWRSVESHRRALADACAQQVVQWLSDAGTGWATSAGFQRLQPGNVAVLVRTTQESEVVRAALNRRGVASVYLSERDSVFRTPEAMDLLRWLQAVAQPRDVRLARAAWGTRLAARSLAELRQLALDDDVLDAHMAQLSRLQAVWQQRGVLALVRQSLFTTGWPARWLVELDGERRLTNVLHLAELLQTAATGLDGETALIRWLSRQLQAEAAEGDEPLLRLESDRNLVQVVTIHASKGLEYPVVCVPFTTLYRQADRSPTLAVRPAAAADGGLALTLTPDASDSVRAEEDRLAEDLRLLYVALTRAQHALWVGFACVGSERALNSGEVRFTDRTHRSAMGYLVAGDGGAAEAEDPSRHWWQSLSRLAEAAPRDAQGVPAWALVAANAHPVQPWVPEPEVTPWVPTRTVTRAFDIEWGIASFSALTRHLRRGAQPGDPSDHRLMGAPRPADDEQSLDSEEKSDSAQHSQALTAPDLDASDALRHRFIRGVQGGHFLHQQLEWLAGEGFALARRPDLAAALQTRCQRQGHAAEADELVRWLTAVCEHPLPGVGVPLSSLTTHLAEMGFWLPSAQWHAATVGECCRRHLLVPLAAAAQVPELAHPDQVPALPDRAFRGMLMGFADLVFEHQGRFGVLDHKSNHLGPGDSAYTAAACVRTVIHHRYDVQAAMYTLALHRLLRSRIGSAYRPDDHLAGAVVLFLRGLGGPGGGGCHLSIPTALLNELEAML